MTTKAQVISGAYSQLRISGITVQPSPSDLALALSRLESMMAELQGTRNFTVNYNFEATPNINSTTNVIDAYRNMMETNLAIRLIPDFNKEVPQALAVQAMQSMSAAIGMVAQENARFVQPSRRMPVGSGNTFRGVFYNRFSIPFVTAPVTPDTKNIYQGETLDYFEDFSAFLGTATIASFTIEADPLITVNSSSISGARILYNITAPTGNTGSNGPYQLINITITDSTGRVYIRLINFNVITPPDVGS
jgi:hypothetical protein